MTNGASQLETEFIVLRNEMAEHYHQVGQNQRDLAGDDRERLRTQAGQFLKIHSGGGNRCAENAEPTPSNLRLNCRTISSTIRTLRNRSCLLVARSSSALMPNPL
jgi:hypothetical protein